MYMWKIFNKHLQVSISAPASFPEGPKWIRMNLPYYRRQKIIVRKKLNKLNSLKREEEEKKRKIRRRPGLLTKREELSLRTVLALPNASKTGLVWTTWSSRDPFFWLAASSLFLVEAPTVAKYAITFFVFSVFPAPDSPVINMDWFSLSVKSETIRFDTIRQPSVCSNVKINFDAQHF